MRSARDCAGAPLGAFQRVMKKPLASQLRTLLVMASSTQGHVYSLLHCLPLVKRLLGVVFLGMLKGCSADYAANIRPSPAMTRCSIHWPCIARQLTGALILLVSPTPRFHRDKLPRYWLPIQPPVVLFLLHYSAAPHSTPFPLMPIAIAVPLARQICLDSDPLQRFASIPATLMCDGILPLVIQRNGAGATPEGGVQVAIPFLRRSAGTQTYGQSLASMPRGLPTSALFKRSSSRPRPRAAHLASLPVPQLSPPYFADAAFHVRRSPEWRWGRADVHDFRVIFPPVHALLLPLLRPERILRKVSCPFDARERLRSFHRGARLLHGRHQENPTFLIYRKPPPN
ncbi:hypothetical protein C8R44DRAFT_953270 [Mycena epipterygia]|nr:hypothetical protein C8R44DRAFT_953270 [Mycena epipterygia]